MLMTKVLRDRLSHVFFSFHGICLTIIKNIEYHQAYPQHALKDGDKEVPQTPLVPGVVVHSARFSIKEAFSPTDPAQTARLSCAVASLSPLPEADGVVETRVVDLSWLMV